MNLIANTGLQFFSFPLEIDMNDNEKMYFHEWFDVNDVQRKLEIAHYFSEDEIWVKKHDLHKKLGLAPTRGKVGRYDNGKFIPYTWEEIKDDFSDSIIKYEESDDGGRNCFPIEVSRCQWDKFENKWLPCPFFQTDKYHRTIFGPTNWCRIMLVPAESSEKNKKCYTILFAFDTRTVYQGEDYEDEDLSETPVFSTDKSEQQYAICNDEYALVDFCSKKPRDCGWVDEYLIDLYHSTEFNKIKKVDDLKCKKPKMRYLAEYIFIMHYLSEKGNISNLTLFSNKNIEYIDVDMVIDMGNSRTCAVLFDNHDFTKVRPLRLQNFTTPLLE